MLAKQDTPSWDELTRQVVERRLAVPREPRFFTAGGVGDAVRPVRPHHAATALAARPCHWRPTWTPRLPRSTSTATATRQLPHQGEAWQRGLAALDAEAQAAHGGRFHTLPPNTQDSLIKRMQEGELGDEAWGGMPCKLFFEHRVIADITHAYYAHPTAWNEMGFGGPASPRGYVRMQLDRRDPWEAAEAKPGEEARARRENQRAV